MSAWIPNSPARLVAWLGTLIVLLAPHPASAVFASLRMDVEGSREVVSFQLASAQDAPRVELMEPQVLRVTIPGLLALPTGAVNLASSRFVSAIDIGEIPGGEVGLIMTLSLKEPFLLFRGRTVAPRRSRTGAQTPVFRLELERPPRPGPGSLGRLIEARTMPGRDGTLLILSYTGSVRVKPTVNISEGLINLRWTGIAQDPRQDPSWIPIEPGGLLDRAVVYRFEPNAQPPFLEMELGLNTATSQVFFHPDPEDPATEALAAKAGLFIVEMRRSTDLGRGLEAQELVQARAAALDSGVILPLNRLAPLFLNSPYRVELADQEVDAAYFFERAQWAERDHQFAQARAWLASLLETFPYGAEEHPDAPDNRELAALYRLDLASRMNWKPGWLLQEIEEVLAHFPNTHRFAEIRLMQLRAFNDAARFEAARALMNDPNLPRNDPNVLLEQGRAAIGLRLWDEADHLLRQGLTSENSTPASRGRARLLLARMMNLQDDGDGAVMMLDMLTEPELARLSDDPALLLEVGDLYYQNRRFDEAYASFQRFLRHYPEDPIRSPWALLRVGDSQRHRGELVSALRLFDQLALQFPESAARVWARIFKVQIETDRPLEDRLEELAGIIAERPMMGAQVEAFLTEADLVGTDGQRLEALNKLNRLLRLTTRDADVARAQRLKHQFLGEGMTDALANGRPEWAVALAEAFGANWLIEEGFEAERLHLAEGLLRMGLADRAQTLLADRTDPVAVELFGLAEAFAAGSLLEPTLIDEEPPEISTPAARVRLAQAGRLAERKEWEGILILLEDIASALPRPEDRDQRLRLLGRAEAARGRFPQAVASLEELLFGKPVGDGSDHYWYATVQQAWRGDDKALPIFQNVVDAATDPEIKALAHLRIGDILQRAGDLDGARASYREAARLNPAGALGGASRENDLQLEMVQGMDQ